MELLRYRQINYTVSHSNESVEEHYNTTQIKKKLGMFCNINSIPNVLKYGLTPLELILEKSETQMVNHS